MLSIILPTRNEEQLIKKTLNSIINHLNKRKQKNYEILIIINGSIDKTEKIVQSIAKQDNKIKVLHSNPGYGPALRCGLENAKGDYVIIYNVDFYDLNLINLIDADLYGKDLIIGSKRAHWGEDNRPISRKLVSFSFNLLLKILFGFKGSDTHGIKLIRKTIIKKIYPTCKTDSGIFDTEFVLKTQKAGYRIADFPVAVHEIRPSRFPNRLWQTPKDIYYLIKSFK